MYYTRMEWIIKKIHIKFHNSYIKTIRNSDGEFIKKLDTNNLRNMLFEFLFKESMRGDNKTEWYFKKTT